jgi:hypothetical protein
MVGRRTFLGGVGAAAAAVGAARLLQTKAGSAGSESPLGSAGVVPGAAFGTCTVLDATQRDDGAIAVRMLGSDGRRFELEFLGHDARTPGVARGGSLGVYVNNHGRGDTATDEEHGLAAMALAAHLGRFEAAGGALPLLPTMAERAMRGDRARARIA